MDNSEIDLPVRKLEVVRPRPTYEKAVGKVEANLPVGKL